MICHSRTQNQFKEHISTFFLQFQMYVMWGSIFWSCIPPPGGPTLGIEKNGDVPGVGEMSTIFRLVFPVAAGLYVPLYCITCGLKL